MAKPSRKRGGKRPGAGRPKGSKNTLEYGEVAAIAAAKLRVPEEADPSVKFIAGRALIRMLEAMEGKVWEKQGRTVLAAATRIREEACGPLAQKVEHRVQLEDLTDEQLEARYRAALAKVAPTPEATPPTTPSGD